MSGGNDGRLVSFVTETEIEAIKKKRQEQWDKVRKPGDPKEAPQEASYDPRPLYERLKEQRDKQQEEWDERFKFKNMIYQGLDEEEAGFLNLVTYQQSNRDSELLQQERHEINAFKTAVSQLNAEESEKKLNLSHQTSSSVSHVPISPTTTDAAGGGGGGGTVKKSSKSQLSLIAGAIRRKRTSSESSTGHAPSLDDSLPDSKVTKTTITSSSNRVTQIKEGSSHQTSPTVQVTATDSMKVSGPLISLASYSSSSSEEEEEEKEKKKEKKRGET